MAAMLMSELSHHLGLVILINTLAGLEKKKRTRIFNLLQTIRSLFHWYIIRHCMIGPVLRVCVCYLPVISVWKLIGSYNVLFL